MCRTVTDYLQLPQYPHILFERPDSYLRNYAVALVEFLVSGDLKIMICVIKYAKKLIN